VAFTAHPVENPVPECRGMSERQGSEAVRQIHSQETLGLTKREWFPWNLNIDLPPDQTPDDKRSLTFDSAPLTEDLEMLGGRWPRSVSRARSRSPSSCADQRGDAGGRVVVGELWGAESHPPRRHERPAALEPGATTTWRCLATSRRIASREATASGWRSVSRSGRCCGRRRNRYGSISPPARPAYPCR